VEIFRLLSQFADDTAFILFWFALVLLVVIIAYWFYNRRKFHSLRHQIPASVVKNYLDSIIQNSTALKSSLFRGGGLDVGGGVPSVVPLSDLPMGHSVSGSGISQEELNQKNAQISMLNGQLAEKRQTVADLEAKVRDLMSRPMGGGDSGEGTKILQNEIASLQKKLQAMEAELASAKAGGGGGNPDAERQLTEVTKERDELKERLMEYEIIEEDLANLKRLQQENEQLKKSLAAQGGAPVAAAAAVAAPKAAPAAAPAPAPEPEPEAAAEPEEDLEAAMAAAIAETKPAPKAAPAPAPAPAPAAKEAAADVPTNEGEQKSAEELLSEFEKMLG